MDKVISNEINNGNIVIKRKNKITSPHRLSKNYSALLEKKKVNSNKKKKKNSKISYNGKKKKITINPVIVRPKFIKTMNSPKKKIYKKSLIQNNTRNKIVNKKIATKVSISPTKVLIPPKKVELPNKVSISPTKVLIPPKKVELPKKNISQSKKPRRFSKKKLHKKHTKSRKISFTCYPQNNKNVNDVIKKADKMSNDQIKKELLSEGIEIKSDKHKLLKDIYMFTSMGGIKINKE
jgi:hypothetical protein